MMKTYIKSFEELTNLELYKILNLRSEVFVTEQEIIYNDLDFRDIKSYHAFTVSDDKIVSYLRIIPAGIAYEEVSLGRVATNKSYRGKGLSRDLILYAIDFIVNNMNENNIKISAQAYLLKFYESLGFVVISDIYTEEGIFPRLVICR